MLVGDKEEIKNFESKGTHWAFVLKSGERLTVLHDNVYGTSVLNRDCQLPFMLARKSFTHYVIES